MILESRRLSIGGRLGLRLVIGQWYLGRAGRVGLGWFCIMNVAGAVYLLLDVYSSGLLRRIELGHWHRHGKH